MPKDLSKVGYLYFIESEAQESIKIGFAENVGLRLSNLQTGNPSKLSLLGTIGATLGAEIRLHQLLKPYRVNREWYDCPALVLSIQNELLDIALDNSMYACVDSGSEDIDRKFAEYVLSVEDIEEAAAEVLADYKIEHEWATDVDDEGEQLPLGPDEVATKARLEARFGILSEGG